VRADFNRDLAAGITVGVMLIPQGMAYALIAGLPPVYGLYAALVPLIVYGLLGTSRQLAVGPVAMVALLVANGVGHLAGGDAGRYLALAVTLSLLTGIIQLTMGLLRAGFLVNLLSHPVLAGFTSAAAIIIGMSQLGGLTGLAIPKGPVHEMLIGALGQSDATHVPTLLLGGGAILAGLGLRRWAPKLPAPMLVVAVGTLTSWGLALGAEGVAIVGEIPTGLPSLAVPGVGFAGVPSVADVVLLPSDVTALVPIALAIALVGFMESIAVAKVYASRERYDIDADQELKALGAANIAGSLFHSFPVTGGFSRTAVNAQAGARSQLSSLIGVLVIGVTLLVLTPLFYHLPKAILAAVIVVAVAGLVDLRTARTLWTVDRRDFALMLATFVVTLALGIEEGILTGVALSVIVVLHQIATPHIAVLGRMPDSNQYRNVLRNPDVVVEPDIAVIRMDSSLFYGNAEAFRDAVRNAVRDLGPGFTLVLDAYPMNRTDSTGLHVLRELIDEIRRCGGDLRIAGTKGPLRDALCVSGVVEDIGEDHLHSEVWRAVEAVRRPVAA
jgi:SulP family sulfate permease